jgi:hypothetical protein
MTIIGGIILIVVGIILMYLDRYVGGPPMSTIVRIIGILFVIVGIIVLLLSLFSGIALF